MAEGQTQRVRLDAAKRLRFAHARRGRARRVPLALLAGATFFASVACATYTDINARMRERLDVADYDAAMDEANGVLKVKDEKKLPRKWKKDTGLAVLERATILHALGAYELSARDFQAAEEELEMLDISPDVGGNIARWVYSESASKYKQPPTERLALNAINLENYLMRGDLKGARVEAKRFTVMRNYLLDFDPEHAHGEFGSYMAGFVFEKLGARDEALRYYDEALQQRDFATLRGPIARLSASPGGFTSPRIEAYKASAASNAAAEEAETEPETVTETGAEAEDEPETEGSPSDGEEGEGDQAGSEAPATRTEVVALMAAGEDAQAEVDAEVLVVVKLGRVPHKVPQRIPIGAAIGLGSAFITGDTTLLQYGALKFIVYPELVGSTDQHDGARVEIDGYEVGVELASDLGAEITREYDELKPRIIGAALSRMIARAATGGAMQAAGAATANSGGENSGMVGALLFLGGLAAEGAMVALDKPDTRSWTTLPARVYIARARVPAGAHKVQITTVGGGGALRKEVDVDIRPGGFAAIDFTTLQ